MHEDLLLVKLATYSTWNCESYPQYVLLKQKDHELILDMKPVHEFQTMTTQTHTWRPIPPVLGQQHSSPLLLQRPPVWAERKFVVREKNPVALNSGMHRHEREYASFTMTAWMKTKQIAVECTYIRLDKLTLEPYGNVTVVFSQKFCFLWIFIQQLCHTEVEKAKTKWASSWFNKGGSTHLYY